MIPAEGNFNEAVPVQPGAVNGDSPIPYSITDADPGGASFGNVDLALTVDPQNPNITYLGGFGGNGYNSDTGLIRVDATNLQDDDSLVGVLYNSQGNLTLQTTAWTTIDSVTDGEPAYFSEAVGLVPADYLNFIRDPYDPFLVDSTLTSENVASFTNSGDGATWTPMDVPTTSVFNPPGEFTGTLTVGSAVVTGISSTTGLEPGDYVTGAGLPAYTFIESVNSSTSVTLSADSTVNGVEGLNNEISGTGYQILLTEVDPTTGLTRLIAGNLTGIYSGLDDNGTFEATIGSFDPHARDQSQWQPRSRPGLLRCGPAQQRGRPGRRGLVLRRCPEHRWTGVRPQLDHRRRSPVEFPRGAAVPISIASGTAVDEQGNGTLFQYWSPGQGGGGVDSYTDFVQVNGVGRTYGLLQASNGGHVPDPQWGGDELRQPRRQPGRQR